jgi:hypothetical protein
LAVRRNSILSTPELGVSEVGWIGNAAHQAECSDHNPDAIGRVHAIDIMTMDPNIQQGVVEWALAHPDDIDYVINRRTIWSYKYGFAPRVYTGSDPHTNHVHISGRHGSSHSVPHVTCTGYSLAAEAITPEGFYVVKVDLTSQQIKDIGEAAAEAVWAFPIQNNVLGANGKPVGPVKAHVFITSLNSQVNDLHNALPAAPPSAP